MQLRIATDFKLFVKQLHGQSANSQNILRMALTAFIDDSTEIPTRRGVNLVVAEAPVNLSIKLPDVLKLPNQSKAI